VILVDGFITSAAVLVASRLQPHVLQRCVFAHRSGERGHQLMLAQMQAEPLLDLGLRLGEGSGAALAWPLLLGLRHPARDGELRSGGGVGADCGSIRICLCVATTEQPQSVLNAIKVIAASAYQISAAELFGLSLSSPAQGPLPSRDGAARRCQTGLTPA
jgi:hypothetical protein